VLVLNCWVTATKLTWCFSKRLSMRVTNYHVVSDCNDMASAHDYCVCPYRLACIPKRGRDDSKTICVVQRNGNPVVGNEINSAIMKWGKLAVVSRPEQADLVLEVTQTGELNLGTGSGNQAAATLLHRLPGANVWATTKGGGWAMSGWSNAWVGRSIAEDLVKFIESEQKTNK
jgi:hypothetical protein